jgi:predicted TIM-barrel fold metal-dependent hydrolase
MREQLLDRVGIERAILSFDVGQEASQPNPGFAVALTKAQNDWSIDRWLTGVDDRLYGAMIVSPQVPAEAAAEIRRVGSHSRIMEVLLPDNGLGLPLGHPVYHPIYEAAAELDLPIAIHFGSAIWGGLGQMSGGGLPMTRLEYYAVLNQAGQHHVASFIAHGVFEKYPSLRLIMLECGFNWAPWLFWGLDSHYAELRRESPWVKKAPSEYFYDHIWLSTQPIEPGDRPQDMRELLESFDGLEDKLCFATDYPHWDSDEDDFVARHLPPAWVSKVLYENARKLFKIKGASRSPERPAASLKGR